jgi:hypothetical protein
LAIHESKDRNLYEEDRRPWAFQDNHSIGPALMDTANAPASHLTALRRHLTPAYGGLAVFLLGLGLSYPYLSQPGTTQAERRRFRGK